VSNESGTTARHAGHQPHAPAELPDQRARTCVLYRAGFLAVCLRFGLTTTLLPGILWALLEKEAMITDAMLDQAALAAGVPMAEEYREMLLECFLELLSSPAQVSPGHIENQVPPAIVFDPVPPGMSLELERLPLKMSVSPGLHSTEVPKNIEDVAFYTIQRLAAMLRHRTVSSLDLTEMYLERLRRFDPMLRFVITLTEDRALAQAREADAEITSGNYRGPLHGIPWGAKDLFAVKGYRTTWGASSFEDRIIDEDATVVQRLDSAGAVLIAKLALGTLAHQSDRWFGGTTRNPWDLRQGSSGSSSGSAAATAAGCVAFALASDSMGSIAAPCSRCGVTGLRPSFGRVPRSGAMAFSWSVDKIGPICRSVEDCAIVLSAIYGPDGRDRSVKNAAFNWDGDADWTKLRVGYSPSDFPTAAEPDIPKEIPHPTPLIMQRSYDRRYERAALENLRCMGVSLVPVQLRPGLYRAMMPIVLAEAAAALDFASGTSNGREQGSCDGFHTFRPECYIPAVEYIQANRMRMMIIEATNQLFEQVDVIVAPTESPQLILTNLTGHPAVFLPNGFRGEEAPSAPLSKSGEMGGGGAGTPVSFTFIGPLYGEAKLLALARAYQVFTGFHHRHPPLFEKHG